MGEDEYAVSEDEYAVSRPVHPPYSSVFVTEFNPEYGNTDFLIWLRKRSSPKYGNAHHLNIFFTVISCIKNVTPSVGNAHGSGNDVIVTVSHGHIAELNKL